jgi:hypothetical protein
VKLVLARSLYQLIVCVQANHQTVISHSTAKYAESVKVFHQDSVSLHGSIIPFDCIADVAFMIRVPAVHV